MEDNEIVNVLWELSTSAKTKLGVGHVTWLLRRQDYKQVIVNKLLPGWSSVPEAYQELQDILSK